MKKRRTMRFSSQLTLYVLSINLVLILLVSVCYYWQWRERALADIREGLTRAAANSASQIDATIQTAEDLFVDLMGNQALFDFFLRYDTADVSPSRAHDEIYAILAPYLLHREDIRSVQFLSSGGIFYSVNSSYASIFNIEHSSLYKRALAAETRFFWTPTYDFTEEYGHVALQDVSVPIADRYVLSLAGLFNAYSLENSRLRFLPARVEKPVLVVNIRESLLREVLLRGLFREDAMAFVATAEGRIVAGAREGEALGELPLELREAPGEALFTARVAGVNLLVCRTTLSNGWSLLSAVSEDEIEREVLTGIGGTVAVFALLTLLVCLALGVVVSRRLYRPIQLLRGAIERSGGGDFDQRVDASSEEFQALFEEYNRMNQRIRDLIEDNYGTRLREKEHEMQALRYQTSPHFLYNALSVIHISATRDATPRTARLVMRLAKMLNYTARDARDTVALSEELDNVRDYMTLVEEGYEGTIRCLIDVPEGLGGTALPKLCLQPLVENAVNHGLHGKGGGTIRISARIAAGAIELCVADDGVGLPENFALREGAAGGVSIGLMNVYKRLKLLYGDSAAFAIENAPEGGARVRLRIPLGEKDFPRA